MAATERRRARRGRTAAVLALVLAAPGLGAADDRAGWGDPCRAADAGRSAAIHDLYERRGRSPVWLTRAGRTPAGARLVELLRAAGDAVMTACLETALADPGGRYARGELDVMLTDAYLALGARRTRGGDDVDELLAVLEPGREPALRDRLDALGPVSSASTSAAITPAASVPGADAAAGMDDAIARYRRIVAGGGWRRIGRGPALEPGMRDGRVPALRARLAATGDLASGAAGGAHERYDGDLVDAVQRFQRRHGLEDDGVVGGDTRAALDVPARRRLARLEANRDRMARDGLDSDGPVVRVNIPDFRVALIDDGRVVFTSRAIVGRPDSPTPALHARITGITLNPAWDVPRSIVREELAARFARDPGYAERNGFHAANSDRSLTEFDWRDPPMVPVRQAPGPANALGRVKFEMPNASAIYLHDTPERHLFDARRRAFSAGCVRVEEPLTLAARLTGIGVERLERMAADGDTRTLRLGWRVPVRLVYYTAWVDPEGRVQFRPDVYGRDPAGAAGAG